MVANTQNISRICLCGCSTNTNAVCFKYLLNNGKKAGLDTCFFSACIKFSTIKKTKQVYDFYHK